MQCKLKAYHIVSWTSENVNSWKTVWKGWMVLFNCICVCSSHWKPDTRRSCTWQPHKAKLDQTVTQKSTFLPRVRNQPQDLSLESDVIEGKFKTRSYLPGPLWNELNLLLHPGICFDTFIPSDCLWWSIRLLIHQLSGDILASSSIQKERKKS